MDCRATLPGPVNRFQTMFPALAKKPVESLWNKSVGTAMILPLVDDCRREHLNAADGVRQDFTESFGAGLKPIINGAVAGKAASTFQGMFACSAASSLSARARNPNADRPVLPGASFINHSQTIAKGWPVVSHCYRIMR